MGKENNNGRTKKQIKISTYEIKQSKKFGL